MKKIHINEKTWEACLISYANLKMAKDEPIKPIFEKTVVCCPFHKEKTPSFFLDFNAMKYRCFSCGKKGIIYKLRSDVTDFRDEQELLNDKG